MNMLKFVQQFIKAPRTVGGIMPSSQKLASAVARTALEHLKPGQILVEIGPGTGNITRELRRELNPETKIHLIENNTFFFDELKKNYPHEILYPQGFETVDLWKSNSSKIILSSLPWLSLPQNVVDAGLSILTQELVNHPDSLLIQYTYGMIDPIPFNDPQILDIPEKVVWLNFPPARIWLYKKKPTKKSN